MIKNTRRYWFSDYSPNAKKKKNHDAKISEIERKYFHTSDYNKFMSDIIDAKMKQQKTNKQTNKKSDISNPVKNSYLNLKT